MDPICRSLLDDQCQVLRKLRSAVAAAYSITASVPTMARNGHQGRRAVAAILARLATEERIELENYHKQISHLIQPSPVVVPLLSFDDLGKVVTWKATQHKSACGGAAYLLTSLSLFTARHAGMDAILATDDRLLRERMIQNGLPAWVDATPSRELRQLGDLAETECNVAMCRIAQEFWRRGEVKVAATRPNDAAMPRVVALWTDGVADDRLLQAADIVCRNGTTDEKLHALSQLLPIPIGVSARQIGELLGVSSAAVKKTRWWTKNRAGLSDELVDRRRDVHHQRSKRRE